MLSVPSKLGYLKKIIKGVFVKLQARSHRKLSTEKHRLVSLMPIQTTKL